MLDVKDNFKRQYLDTNCIFGCNESDSQYHLLNCGTILKHCPQLYNDEITEYEDISGNIDKQVQCAQLFQHIWDVRVKLLNTC